jgi:uncharacterized membrane protein YsdA (DUF1294 family)/cold shock CspA family protein
MKPMNTPQTGTIKAWNDARGFGFVRPDGGGEDVFLHIKALPPQSPRPQIGARVRYERVLSADRKPRAAGARLLAAQEGPRARAPAQPPHATRGATRPARPRTGAGAARYASLFAFAALYAVCSLLWPVPAWVAGIYLGMSAVTYWIYALDKRAAQVGGWRVSEKNLLVLGLFCGWPGAVVAQQRLRHKSSKTAFLVLFWGTVALNVAGFVALAGTRQLH